MSDSSKRADLLHATNGHFSVMYRIPIFLLILAFIALVHGEHSWNTTAIIGVSPFEDDEMPTCFLSPEVPLESLYRYYADLFSKTCKHPVKTPPSDKMFKTIFQRLFLAIAPSLILQGCMAALQSSAKASENNGNDGGEMFKCYATWHIFCRKCLSFICAVNDIEKEEMKHYPDVGGHFVTMDSFPRWDHQSLQPNLKSEVGDDASESDDEFFDAVDNPNEDNTPSSFSEGMKKSDPQFSDSSSDLKDTTFKKEQAPLRQWVGFAIFFHMGYMFRVSKVVVPTELISQAFNKEVFYRKFFEQLGLSVFIKRFTRNLNTIRDKDTRKAMKCSLFSYIYGKEFVIGIVGRGNIDRKIGEEELAFALKKLEWIQGDADPVPFVDAFSTAAKEVREKAVPIVVKQASKAIVDSTKAAGNAVKVTTDVAVDTTGRLVKQAKNQSSAAAAYVFDLAKQTPNYLFGHFLTSFWSYIRLAIWGMAIILSISFYYIFPRFIAIPIISVLWFFYFYQKLCSFMKTIINSLQMRWTSSWSQRPLPEILRWTVLGLWA